MESIYKYICKNIQNNGKLKDGFNLDMYSNIINGELKFASGALDGMNAERHVWWCERENF